MIKNKSKLLALFWQAIKFFGISGVGWLLDFAAFSVFNLLMLPISVSNTISSMFGVTFVYLFSTRKTFISNHARLSLKQKYLFYILYQIIMIACMSALIAEVNQGLQAAEITWLMQYTKLISKMLVTPISMVCNFFLMKLLIERV